MIRLGVMNIIVVVIFCAASTLLGQGLTINNSSFEIPALSPGGYTQGWVNNINGWTVSPANTFWGGFDYPSWWVPDGNQCLWSTTGGWTLSQNLSACVVPGLKYKLSAYFNLYWGNAQVKMVLLFNNSPVSQYTWSQNVGGKSWDLRTIEYVASASDEGKAITVQFVSAVIGMGKSGYRRMFENNIWLQDYDYFPAFLAIFRIAGLTFSERVDHAAMI